jgi:hypothetical protein
LFFCLPPVARGAYHCHAPDDFSSSLPVNRTFAIDLGCAQSSENGGAVYLYNTTFYVMPRRGYRLRKPVFPSFLSSTSLLSRSCFFIIKGKLLQLMRTIKRRNGEIIWADFQPKLG